MRQQDIQKHKRCKFCGTHHDFVKDKCPAYKSKCDTCHQTGRLSDMCRTKRINMVDNGSSEDFDNDIMTNVSSALSMIKVVIFLCVSLFLLLWDRQMQKPILGLANHLQNFAPNLADIFTTAPIKSVLKRMLSTYLINHRLT